MLTYQHLLPHAVPTIFERKSQPTTAVRRLAPLPFLVPATKTNKYSVWDYLGTIGTGAFFLLGITQLSIPLMIKHRTRINKFALAAINQSRNLFQLKPRQKNLQFLFKDRKEIEAQFKKLGMFLSFVQGINIYQTAVNSKQPSLFVQAILRDSLSLAGIFWPKDILYSLYSLAGVFFCLGKQNDIENNIHPESRRDWDIKRLNRFILPDRQGHVKHNNHTFSQELLSFTHFIRDDFKENFSSKHWKTLLSSFKAKESWTKPQSYLNGIASQFTLLSLIMNMGGLLGKKSNLLKWSTIPLTLGALLNTIPLFTRSWQNKRELDGQLVIGGSPLGIIGAIFQPQFFPKLFFLNGLSGIGGPMFVKGLELNSKRYRAMVDEIEWIHQLALQNPTLKASDILAHFNGSPSDLNTLQKRIGRSRVTYILKLLQRADQIAKSKGVNLAEFMSKDEYKKDPHQMIDAP